jgi:hypothetical protein
MAKLSFDPPGPHGEAVVLKPVVRVGVAVILGDVRWRPEAPGVASRLDPGPERGLK